MKQCCLKVRRYHLAFVGSCTYVRKSISCIAELYICGRNDTDEGASHFLDRVHISNIPTTYVRR